MQTWVDLPFADGVYTFKLGLAQIAEIERKCDAGIGAIYARTSKGRHGLADGDIVPDYAEYRFGELVEVVLQGLIGGASGQVNGQPVRVSSILATQLVDRYISRATDERMAMTQLWALAFRVLSALIHGYTPPKGEAGGAPPVPTTD